MKMKCFAGMLAVSFSFCALATESAYGADKSGSQSNKTSNDKSKPARAKITGIGGVFFKSKKDQKALNDWYSKNLGITLEPWGGAILKWSEDKAEDGGVTVLHVVEPDSDMFNPGTAPFMINYRIDNMARMVAQLKANGVKIVKGPESAENGKFLWVMDPEGNKVELWEPMIWNEKNKKK